MRQNINLYQDVLIDKPEPLQGRQAGVLLLGVGLVLVLVSLFSYWRVHTQEQQLSLLQQQTSLRTQAVEQLEKQYPPRKKDPALEKKLRLAEQQLVAEKQLVSHFAPQQVQDGSRILQSLEGLAEHVRPGIWLKGIQLSEAGAQVQLSGTALKPELVPEYLQYLGQQGVFSEQIFSSLSLNRLKEKTGEVDFSLQTLPERQP